MKRNAYLFLFILEVKWKNICNCLYIVFEVLIEKMNDRGNRLNKILLILNPVFIQEDLYSFPTSQQLATTF